MTQLNEETMHLRRVKDGVAAEPETWRRCNVTSSLTRESPQHVGG